LRRHLTCPYAAAMRRFETPPSADEIEALARRALEALPAPFADHLTDVVLLVEDFADDETLRAMEIEDPFDLTGIYEGIPLTERSVDQSGTLPDRIRLFRRPILDEWADGGDTLEHLVAHVLIHEVGHHFGLSDEDMHALEDAVA
jgi:predicted Zn-dependent protease with MMP-like domain